MLFCNTVEQKLLKSPYPLISVVIADACMLQQPILYVTFHYHSRSTFTHTLVKYTCFNLV